MRKIEIAFLAWIFALVLIYLFISIYMGLCGNWRFAQGLAYDIAAMWLAEFLLVEFPRRWAKAWRRPS